MTDLFLLSQAQMRRIVRYFPLSHGVARVDDRRIVSAIVFVIKNGLRWRDAPPEYGPHKTIYNRFVRWSRNPEWVMIDATHLKAHRTAASLLKRACSPTIRARTKVSLNSKLHAVCDGNGRPLVMLLSEGQMSDYKDAALMLSCHAESQAAAGRQGLRRRLVPRRPRQAPHHPLHSFQSQPQNRDPA